MTRKRPSSRPVQPRPARLPLVLAAAGALAVGAGPLPAQQTGGAEGRVDGLVLSAETRAPISGARVEAVGTDRRVNSDAGGRFTLRNLPAGPAVFRVTRLGYEPREEEVRVVPGETVVLRVSLDARPVDLDPVLVRHRRTRMVGDPLNVGVVPGSAHFLSAEDLEARRLAVDNVHDVLRRIPGVNVQDEEGYGLRPNIGMRGTGVSRSSNVTIMEDGVLAAPAPYAAPAAYYFPTVGRMEAVEVRKGSSQIRYGPRTIGGAINLVSSSIPDRLSWNVDVQGGQDRTGTARARVGDSGSRFGWMAETYQARSDGFKHLEGGGDTGFRTSDYVGKLRLSTDRDAPRYQELELKLGYQDHRSDETYLGLTTADFRTSPLARYPASQPDRIDTEHTQIQLRHFLRAHERVDLTTTLYRNDFARNWYKLQSVLGTPIGGVLDEPEAFDEELAILRGADSEADAFMVRANNREYFSRGIQSVLGLRLESGPLAHDLELGVRLHEDREDRFQWEDGYRMAGGRMVLTSEGTPGTQANRISDARALSLYLQDEIEAGRLTLVPGVRYERVDFTRRDFPTDDPSRDAPVSTRENRVSAVIPGIGAAFRAAPSVHLFGGVHRGFGPPGPGATEETRSENSVNYEAGARVRGGGLALQVAGFFSDYRNILGMASLATGESGAGDLFNGGAVHTAGVESSVEYDLAWAVDLPVRLPVSLAYTFTHATFRTAFESDFGPWGTVERGDHLPYLPRHQFSGSVGVEEGAWGVTLSGTGSTAMRTRAGRGPILEEESTDAFLVLNLRGEYRPPFPAGGTLFAGIQNLTDRHYIVARRPAGARPGMPRTLFLGFRVAH